MSLKSLERLRRTLGFRLTLWYSAIFILSALALVVLAYFFLASSLRRADHRIILSRLEDYRAEYRTGGISALQQEIRFERDAGQPNQFLIRVGSQTHRTLFLSLPDHWAGLDLKPLSSPSAPGQAWTRIGPPGGENTLEVAAVALPDGNILQVGKNIDPREDLLETFRGVFAGVTLLVIVLGVVGGQFLAFRALRPVRQLILTMRAIADTGKIAARMPISPTGDELEDLTRLFNQMLEKIEALINGMKETLDNVAHDLRTPMTRLRGMAEMALQGQNDLGTCREALADCLEESERLLRMMNTLMDISEAETGAMNLTLENVDLPELLDQVIDLYRYVSEDKHITLATSYPRELYLSADRDRLGQALANLLDNAVKYTPDGGRVEVEAYAQPPHIVAVVKDGGPGIPPHEIARIWDRLYRGDKSRSQRGLGLGLSLVKAIIEAHHGHVEVASEAGAGSVFTVYLPQPPS